jgi:hypothetical protein
LGEAAVDPYRGDAVADDGGGLLVVDVQADRVDAAPPCSNEPAAGAVAAVPQQLSPLRPQAPLPPPPPVRAPVPAR